MCIFMFALILIQPVLVLGTFGYVFQKKKVCLVISHGLSAFDHIFN